MQPCAKLRLNSPTLSSPQQVDGVFKQKDEEQRLLDSKLQKTTELLRMSEEKHLREIDFVSATRDLVDMAIRTTIHARLQGHHSDAVMWEYFVFEFSNTEQKKFKLQEIEPLQSDLSFMHLQPFGTCYCH